MSSKLEELDQITATSLLEDLKNSETKIKINAVHNLRGISFALGTERTRKKLLPYLISCIEEEEDETLIELAKILSNFLDCIGGKQYSKELFNIIENLLTIDESNVRKESINALKNIIKQIGSMSEVEKDIMEMINNLSEKKNINQLISALNVIVAVYDDLNKENKIKTYDLIIQFLQNDSINLKKEINICIPLITQFLNHLLIEKIINLFFLDKNDILKMGIMDVLVSLENHPNLLQMMDYINSVITKLSNDTNWRVKMTVGDKLYLILKFKICSNNIKQNSIDIFSKLLESQESEIKNICCQRLEDMTKILCAEENFEKILISLKKLEKETTPYVRISLASNILKLAPFIGTKKTNDYIFPIFLNIIKDENHDIRMTLIKTLDQLNELVNADYIMHGIIPSFLEISSNKSWRIRIQVMEVIPVLVKILEKKIFMDSIFGICITLLADPVFAIRDANIKLMKKLYVKLKSEEFEKRLIDKLIEMTQSTSYLVRNTVALFINNFCNIEIGENIDDYLEYIENKLSKILLKLCNDKISNVRMNCASALMKMKKITKNKEILEQIDNKINILKKDTDRDVLYMLNK